MTKKWKKKTLRGESARLSVETACNLDGGSAGGRALRRERGRDGRRERGRENLAP